MSSSSSWRGQGGGGRGEGRGGRGPRGRFHSHHPYGQRQPNWQYSLHRAGNPISHHRSWERDRYSHNNAERSRQDQYYPSSQRTQDTTSKKGTGANDDYMSKPIPPKRNRNRDPVMNSSTGTVPGSGANDTAGLPKAAEAVVPVATAVPPPPPSNEGNKDLSNNSNAAATEDVVMNDKTESNAVKRPKIDRDIIITKENWGKSSTFQRLVSESPFETFDLELAKQLETPQEWFDRKVKMAQDTKVEMKALIERDNDRYYDPYDSERSEESVIVGNNYGSCDRTPPGFYKFVETLPYSILLDAGFLVVGVHADDEKNCLCPCSLRMKKWRHNMGLCEPTGLDNCGVSFKKGSPNALMDHIKKMASHENAYLHKALKLYLEKLYDNFWNRVTPGVHHKGLYIAGTNDYKRAEAAQKKDLQSAIKFYKKEVKRQEDLIKQQEKKLNELAEVKKANPSMAEKMGHHEENREALGLEEEGKIPTINDIDEETLYSFKNLITSSIEMHRRSIMESVKSKDKKKIVITTPPKINIQDLFDKWYEEDSKDKTYIFRSLDTKSKLGQYAHKVLCEWDVNIEVPSEVMRKSCEDEDDIMTAVDQGGPTRTFITAFCEQLRDLCVYVPLLCEEKLAEPPPLSRVQTWVNFKKGIVVRTGKETRDDNNKETEEQKKIRIKFEDGHEELLERAEFEVLDYPFPLFGESCASSAVPCRDDTFESLFYNINKNGAIGSDWNLEFLLSKVHAYYEAIGRVIIHSLFDEKVVLSSVVMPHLLRKYLFHGIRPDHGSHYPLSELLVDVQNMEPGFSIKKLREKKLLFAHFSIDDELIERHNFHSTATESDVIVAEKEKLGDKFRSFLVLYMIKSREKALEHIRKGLTLGGRLRLQESFFAVPPVILNSMYFSNPKYDLGDILKILIFVPYEEGSVRSIIKDSHQLFQKTTLPSALGILQSKNQDILEKFLYFVTGCSYLPSFELNPHFRINVEFEEKENPNDLPTCHTCVNVIVFPMQVYNNNVETLASKLEKAILFGDCFGME